MTDEPICFRCRKRASELEEYRDLAEAEGYDSAAEAVRKEEGTYNRESGQFCCTECYIAIGMPSRPHPYLLPPSLDPRRKDTVGASEVAALFSALWSGPDRPDDFPPERTRYALWHLKRGSLVEPPEEAEREDDDNRLKIGKFMEPAIGAIAAALRGWRLEPGAFILHPAVPGMSATPDFAAFADAKPLVLPSGVELASGVDLEAKNVDRMIWYKWPRLEKPGVWCWRRGAWEPAQEQPPFKWTLQGQQQMACTGRLAHVILAFVGGNTPRFYLTERHDGAIGRLEAEIPRFWASIKANEEPDPEWALDAATVTALHRYASPGSYQDMRGIPEIATLAAERYRLGKIEAEAKKAKDELSARILQEIGELHHVDVDGFKISAPQINDTPVPAHVRKGHRKVIVTPVKEKS